NTVRIVFVGASTTISSHHMPHSYPEFIGHWLDLWVRERGLKVRIETLNAGRESIGSPSIAAIVRQEALPLQPDLVVYYEGANQFDIESTVPNVPQGPAVRPADPEPRGALAVALHRTSRYSALSRRIEAALGLMASPTSGREWLKPDYRVVWPEGVDEFDPD